ncbi:flagellar biosynthesis protein FlgJ [Hafnia alvei]|uniref:glycoside hydrolase family 73 protein n=1 Tax=Hafnia alvei TaxID=569 RepID=UPI00061CDEC4|nr:glucosaminidase domain-containing protein [Hafnia alvei]KKF38875.1 flagellar rod assembly protein FlgJ [Hafnia alvei]MBW3476756.1 glucosaminidase domain-containing protein [Hafnia alvei]MDU3158871.1 glucosaminidase domain-containing protein [Hafnia alvei]TBL43893.1 flagellar biosynthesis protein FlgJ [Hafnia alvei]TBM11208.1 flagellar biosynthesis protein FlgJ [Hafnia alvei]
MRWRIHHSVGVGQPNFPSDVRNIQILLNRAIRDDNIETLKEDGIWGAKTCVRLVMFQRNHVHFAHPDSIVDLHGPTFNALSRTFGASQHEVSQLHKHDAIIPDSNSINQLAQRAALPLSAKKSEWINRSLPAAIMVKRNWGVPIAVTIAQGAIESAWGVKSNGNVYFGVKGKSPKGKSINFMTHENYGGLSIKIKDSFRSYDSLEQSADDFGRFLTVNKRFSAAFSYPNEPEKFLHEVAKAGYATDPLYENKVLDVMRSTGIEEYDNPSATLSMCYINPMHYFSLIG